MIASFVDFERARLPASALGRLAGLRAHHGVEAALHDRELWVRWTPGDDDVARALLPLPGCRLYGRQAGRWRPWAVAADDRARRVEAGTAGALAAMCCGGRRSGPRC